MRRDPHVPRKRDDDGLPRADELVVAQTRTGYWVVQRGDVPLGGAMTRPAAERERDLRMRLASRRVRRTSTAAGA